MKSLILGPSCTVLEAVKIVRLALATKVIGDGEPIFEALQNAR